MIYEVGSVSKGLEALERSFGSWNYLKDYETIEKELKEYEEMKRIKGTTTLDNALEETLINACPNVAKKLKALENIKVILKDFIEFNVIDLPHINKVHYEIKIFENAIYVSKEKYDLLKEVLNA